MLVVRVGRAVQCNVCTMYSWDGETPLNEQIDKQSERARVGEWVIQRQRESQPFPIRHCMHKRYQPNKYKDGFACDKRRLLMNLFVDVVDPMPR